MSPLIKTSPETLPPVEAAHVLTRLQPFCQRGGCFRLHGQKLLRVVYLFVAAGELFPKVLYLRIGALKLVA